MNDDKNRILIFKEKHGDRYFYVPTPDDLHKAAIKVFKERVKEGYWYYFDVKEPLKPDISREDGLKFKAFYERDLKYYNEILKEKKLYENALNDTTGEIVWKFLRQRQDNEYEGFCIAWGEDF